MSLGHTFLEGRRLLSPGSPTDPQRVLHSRPCIQLHRSFGDPTSNGISDSNPKPQIPPRHLYSSFTQPRNHEDLPRPSTISLSMPRGPSVVLTASATTWQALMLLTSWGMPWELSVPSFNRITGVGCRREQMTAFSHHLLLETQNSGQWRCSQFHHGRVICTLLKHTQSPVTQTDSPTTSTSRGTADVEI